MLNFPWIEFWVSTWQTCYMVVLSSFLSIFLGTGLGILLFSTRSPYFQKNRVANFLLSFLINIVRSIPYVILMIAIIPLTRLIVGTSIGTNAAVVSLTLAAIPFFARLAENAFNEVPNGLLEAAKAMGATPLQMISRVLIPEAMPGILRGATLTVISLIGYSAMAGAVGGGGLGELAINYGYLRFNPSVMVVTVIALILIVQWIQSVGDWLVKRPRVFPITIGAIVLFLSCLGVQLWPTPSASPDVLRVGVMSGVQQKVMDVAARVAMQRYHLKIEFIPFDDYVLPNTSLNSGDLDANIFQHVPYLDAQIKARGFKLTPIAKTFTYPMGFYSRQLRAIDQLQNGAVIAIPSDPSNEARSLLVLEKAGLIRLRAGSGTNASVLDITSNPKNLQIKTLQAAQIPHVMQDVALAAITNDFIDEAGVQINQAIIKEGADSPYVNVIVVRTQDKDRPVLQELVDVMHSKPVVDETEKVFPNGAAVPSFTPT